MPAAKYGWAHQQERARWAPVVAAGQGWCAEPKCLMPTRWVAPGTKWHLLHDPSGTMYIGIGHQRCNVSEGATRGNQQRAKPRRWAL